MWLLNSSVWSTAVRISEGHVIHSGMRQASTLQLCLPVDHLSYRRLSVMYHVGNAYFFFSVEPDLVFHVCHSKPTMTWLAVSCVLAVPVVWKSDSGLGCWSPEVFSTHCSSDLGKYQWSFLNAGIMKGMSVPVMVLLIDFIAGYTYAKIFLWDDFLHTIPPTLCVYSALGRLHVVRSGLISFRCFQTENGSEECHLKA